MRLRRGVAGMTMIEVILLIAIGSFVVMGIVLFTRQMALNATQTRERLAAMDVARAAMEEVMRMNYAALPSGDTDFNLNGYRVRRSVNTTAGWSKTVRDDNRLFGAGQVDEFIVIPFGVRQIQIFVDEPGGDFTVPLVQIVSFKHSHVVPEV